MELGTADEIEASLSISRPDQYCAGAQVAPGFAFIQPQWKIQGLLLQGVTSPGWIHGHLRPGGVLTRLHRPAILLQGLERDCGGQSTGPTQLQHYSSLTVGGDPDYLQKELLP